MMTNSYQIVTDSSSDLSQDFLDKEGIISMPLSFSMDGKEYFSNEMSIKQFYSMLRSGITAKTSQVNSEQAYEVFDRILQKGRDILYIAFSSQMSGTFRSVSSAANALIDKYPDRQIRLVDTLSVSLGEGLLVYFANQKKRMGESIKAVADWIEKHRLNIAHFIAVRDLKYLHLGGRISKASSIVGSFLGVEPIINLNNDGEVKLITSKRGHKNALNALVEYMGTTIGNTVNELCCIAHADCEPDALYVKEQVEKRFGITDFMVNEAGPVLGAHTGPGAVGLFFLAEHR